MSPRTVERGTLHVVRLLVPVLALLVLSSAATQALDVSAVASAARPQSSAHGRHPDVRPGASDASADPAPIWNTFLGGIASDDAYGIAVDSGGNTYVIGTSVTTWQGINPPVRAFTGGIDTYVAKLDAGGALVWNTFLGSENGSDQATAIAVDASGNVYALGYSSASWEGAAPPLRAFGTPNDAFVAKLNSNGALLWNTFLGGGSSDQGYGIAVAEDGDIYVAGSSYAAWQGAKAPVRAYGGNYDAFVAQLDSSGTLIWNTFLGTSTRDESYSLALDDSENVYVAGLSDATWQGMVSPVRAHSAGTDAFVAKLASNGVLIWNTFLGGDGSDYSPGVAVDGSGNIYATGDSTQTWQGSSAPVRAFSAGRDTFVAKLSPAGALTWNTFLGGSGDDNAHGIAADGDGNAYVVGLSELTWGSPLRSFTDNWDSFAAQLSPSGELTWNMFLGGSLFDNGYSIAADANASVYVAGYSYASWDTPVRPFVDSSDAFIVKIGTKTSTFDFHLPLIIR